jgi:hypothetical protein
MSEIDPASADEDAAISRFLVREAGRLSMHARPTPEVVQAISHGADREPRERRLHRIGVVSATAACLLVAAGAMAISLGAPARMPPTPTAAAGVLPVGAPCPVTSGTEADGLPLFGGGDVRLSFANRGGSSYFEMAPGARWGSIEAIWTVNAASANPTVVTGRRLDSTGELRFGDAVDPAGELKLTRPTSAQAIGTRNVVSEVPIRIEGSGCYAVQMATGGAIATVIFRAEPVESAFAELAKRPLTTPVTSHCQASEPSHSQGFLPSLVGSGPVYMTGGSAIALSEQGRQGRYPLVATTWATDSRELGPVVVRGIDVDGAGVMRFGPGLEPPTELRLPVKSYEHAPDEPIGWRIFNSYLRPSTPGCYVIQTDTLAGTSSLMIEFVP